MHVLGIETSGRTGTQAIVADGQIIAESTLSTKGRRHAQTLVQETRSLLDAVAFKPTDIQVIAISNGPGSFTGLRVGAAFAKTFCFATGAQLVAVDTLRCIAERIDPEIPAVHVIEDAQRGDVFANLYTMTGEGERHAADATTIIAVADFAASLEPGAKISGPGLRRYADQLHAFSSADEALWDPQAREVAVIGSAQAARGEYSDITTYEPFYLRKSAAEEKRDAANSPPEQP